MTTRVACLGDSLTRAQFSVDYLDLLARLHPPGEVRPARSGVNGDFAYNLLQRLDTVAANPPDVITVLIGTNDARASLAGYPVEQAMKRKRLPARPSAGWFQECLEAVLARLRAETDATIGLLSLPVLGQRLDGPAAQASQAYSSLISEVAADSEVAYLPLHERQIEELRRTDPPPVPYKEATPAATIGVLVQHAVLRRSLDAIARGRGLVLTTDHIHQNSRGAALVAEVIDTGLLARSG
ncbi:SGNH/GDSL hydrolase family protein [Streptomyces sp. IBSBF 3010]|uniref:SGNH/GDSL hydrolase family protein n=1 Tax=Streptomyces sp. IBSBF 3010 TaxID=2903526 RepID=UPI002FDC0BEB